MVMSTKNQPAVPNKPRRSIFYWPIILASMFKGGPTGGGSTTLRGMSLVGMGNPEFHPKRKKNKAFFRTAHPELLRTRKRRRMQNKYKGKFK